MERLRSLIPYITVALLTACGGGGGDHYNSGDCSGGGWCGTEAITLQADLYGAEALFSVQDNESALTIASAKHKNTSREKEVTISSQSPLFAVTSDGLKQVLQAYSPTNTNALDDLPRLSFVAVSPIGHVFLTFEHPFIYTDSVDGLSLEDYSDPWAPSSPFTCQMFVISKKINEFSEADVTDPPGITCVTNSLELDTWDFRSSLIQFDGDGNAYFSAHVPQNWKNVLIKWQASDGSLGEVINANVCYRDFMVTQTGGVLYTGVTSTSGDCSGDSFLRFKTPSGELQEITRGWWDYTFAPIETGQHAGKILFYGPNPLLATTPDWDDSCLYRFDPSASGSDRSTEIADCDIDIWRYVEYADDTATRRTRCNETKNMMGGGNQPEKILLVDAYDTSLTTYGSPDGTEEIYVAGNIYEKLEGEWRCNICMDAAVYCEDGNGELTAHTDNTACTNAGNTWTASGSNCYNNITSGACTLGGSMPSGWNLNHEWCESPGNNWQTTYSALARVNFDDADPDARTITRLSGDNEAVSNAWTIGNRLIYSAFNASEGRYELLEVTNSTPLLTGIEVYELFQDPRDSSKWFMNGLRFSDNSYIMGTFDPADPASTLEVEGGVTGQIETLVIVPDL